jgi:hypothetical protein
VRLGWRLLYHPSVDILEVKPAVDRVVEVLHTRHSRLSQAL